MVEQCGPTAGIKSLLLLFFRKEESFFFEKKKQKTFVSSALCPP
jgi:hypothetical protein